MILDGIRCKKSNVFGFRYGDPARDLDDQGRPVQSNYIVIVRIRDSKIVTKDGREFYDPKDAPQAVKLGYGGTYYGYAKSVSVNKGQGRWVRVYRNGKTEQEWTCSYIKTPIYFVHDAKVYVGACYKMIEKAA